MSIHNKADTTPVADPAVDLAAENLRAELEGLVRIAARRPALIVREGEPGCNWSFSWDADVVTVDPAHLRELAPDLCRGLALHEASHAAVTVLHRILAEAHLARIMPLLNTIEDIRIEVWMRSRFPGATPWIRAYNDVFYGFNRGQPLPQSRQVQFLLGILELWWYGTTAAGTLPEVLVALDACRGSVAAATACQPPLNDDPEGIVASQRAMWEIVRTGILPTWERLVAMDRREGIQRLATSELSAFTERTGCPGRRFTRGSARLRPRSARSQSGRARLRDMLREVPRPVERPAAPRNDTPDDPSPEGDHQHDVFDPTQANGTDCYLAAWRRIAPVADRLGDELLRVLVPRQRMRWSAGHPWGPRLELRKAMQFEADPQAYRSLWCRPVLPHRRDPAVLLLVDRSASMRHGGLIDRAFEGTVLLTEVCRRIGVPAAVWSFADVVREELEWDAVIDGPARRRLGLLPDTCDGNTDMAAALAVVGRKFTARHGDPKLLFVIGDGEPDKHNATLNAVSRLEAEGIVTVGLGLGPGTAGLARYFQNAVTEIPPERLVDHLADLLGEAILANA
jgi:hypothetical protein